MNLSRLMLSRIPNSRDEVPEDTSACGKVVDLRDIRRQSRNNIGQQNHQLAAHFDPLVPRTVFSLVLIHAFFLIVTSATFATPGAWPYMLTSSHALLNDVFFW